MSEPLLHTNRSRRPIARAASLAGITLLAAALLAWTPGIAAAWNQSGAEATLWQLTNGDRANNGVHAHPAEQHPRQPRPMAQQGHGRSATTSATPSWAPATWSFTGTTSMG